MRFLPALASSTLREDQDRTVRSRQGDRRGGRGDEHAVLVQLVGERVPEGERPELDERVRVEAVQHDGEPHEPTVGAPTRVWGEPPTTVMRHAACAMSASTATDRDEVGRTGPVAGARRTLSGMYGSPSGRRRVQRARRRGRIGRHERTRGAPGARVVAGGARRADRAQRADDPADRDRRHARARRSARLLADGLRGRRRRDVASAPRSRPRPTARSDPTAAAPIVARARRLRSVLRLRGRAGRPDYWWFLLAVLVVTGAATALSEAWARRSRAALAPAGSGRAPGGCTTPAAAAGGSCSPSRRSGSSCCITLCVQPTDEEAARRRGLRRARVEPSERHRGGRLSSGGSAT